MMTGTASTATNCLIAWIKLGNDRASRTYGYRQLAVDERMSSDGSVAEPQCGKTETNFFTYGYIRNATSF